MDLDNVRPSGLGPSGRKRSRRHISSVAPGLSRRGGTADEPKADMVEGEPGEKVVLTPAYALEKPGA